MADSILCQESYVSAQDGKRLFVRQYGDANHHKHTFFCLSGLVRNSDDFDVFARRLARDGHYIVAFDYRGRGRSDYDKNWQNYKAPMMVTDILSVLNALFIEKAIFIGTSLGGLLSMALNGLQPNRIEGLVINDIGPAYDPSGIDFIKSYVGKDHPQKNWEEAIQYVKTNFSSLRFKDDEAWEMVTRGSFQEGEDGWLHVNWDTNIVKTVGLESEVPDLWRLYESLEHTPTLAIRGGISDILSQETFDEMARRKPDLIQVLVEGVGHCPSFDEPIVIRAFGRFLAKLRS